MHFTITSLISLLLFSPCSYHCECLNPPLAEVPAEEWYCPDCEVLQDREREGMNALGVSSFCITHTIL